MCRITLTNEWEKFDGDYQKAVQDVKLHDGTLVFFCWPNNGVFISLQDDVQKEIPYENVAYVRLTTDPNE
jgi:hypothetical protein